MLMLGGRLGSVESQLTAMSELALIDSVTLIVLCASVLGSSEASFKACSRPGVSGRVHRRRCSAWCMLPHMMLSNVVSWVGSPHPCRDRNPHPPRLSDAMQTYQ